jgi:hypothetical protein
LGVSMLKPPTMMPSALTMSAGSLSPGATSVRAMWAVVPGYVATNS